MIRGTQVIFIPHAAAGDPLHPECKAGFVVTGPMGETVFVRYWKKGQEGVTLATERHGQATHMRSLVLHDTIPQAVLLEQWL